MKNGNPSLAARPLHSSSIARTGWAGKIVAVSVYFFVLTWILSGPLVQIFGYQGFGFNLTPIDLFITYLIALTPTLVLPELNGRPSTFIIYVLYLATVIPCCLVAVCGDHLDITECRTMQLSLVGCTFLLCWLTKLPHRVNVNKRPSPSPSLFWGGLLIWSFLFHAFFFLRFRNSIHIISFDDVYDVRAVFFSSGIPAILSYVLIWQIYVFTPALLLFGFQNRSGLLIACCIGFQTMIFLATGLKSVLFSIPLLLCCYLFFSLIRQGQFIIMTLGVSLICAATTLHCLWTDDIGLFSIVVRRALMLPALITTFYFRFFSDFPYAQLGHSVLGKIIKPNYDSPPSKLIGEAFFGSHETSANANIWADGFANFGIFGMLMVTLLLVLVLRYFDKVSRQRDRAIMLSLLAMPTVALTNSALLTCLATHGLGVMMALFYLWPEQTTAIVPDIKLGKSQTRNRNHPSTRMARVSKPTPKRVARAA